ncbi:YodC family protein [Lysobacter terrae]
MATQVKFAIGDIVKLKSGGPEMTVQTQPDPPSQYYNCQWFAGKKLESGRFPSDSLELVKGG